MEPVKVTIEFKDGSIWSATNAEDIRKIGLCLPKGMVWKQGAAKDKLHNKYFLMLTELCNAVRNGDTKADMHEHMKPLIMRKFLDFPQYFTTGVPEYSTKNLTYEGWLATIEQLKTVANDVFNYTFK